MRDTHEPGDADRTDRDPQGFDPRDLDELVRDVHRAHLAAPPPFETVLVRAGTSAAGDVARLVASDVEVLCEHDQAVTWARYACLPAGVRTGAISSSIASTRASRESTGEPPAGPALGGSGRFRQSTLLLRAACTRDVRLPFLALLVLILTGGLGWWWGYQNGTAASRNDEYSDRLLKRLDEIEMRITPTDPGTQSTAEE